MSGFPSAARTDAVMRPLKAVDGCESIWFHWIDDTSGLVECTSAEGARALLEAAGSAAAAAAASAAESEPPRVVDHTQLVLENMTLVQLDTALLYGDDGQKEGEKKEGKAEENICEQEGRGAERPLDEGDTVEEQAAFKRCCFS